MLHWIRPLRRGGARPAATARCAPIAAARAAGGRRTTRASPWLAAASSRDRWQSSVAPSSSSSSSGSTASTTGSGAAGDGAARSREPGEPPPVGSLAVPSQARYNEIGVQQLSAHLYAQVFPRGPTAPPPPELVELARDHLRRHDLLGKSRDTAPPVAFDLPPLVGDTLDQHFYRLGVDAAEPFLTDAKRFARAHLPPKPRRWARRSGWTKYHPDGRAEPVAAPDARTLCFDTEVMWKEHPFAVMACAAGPDAWYAWLSPWLLGESENPRQLIPLGDPAADRVVVGHNVGYDRARVLEEYDLAPSRTAFLDTMSLHVAVNGMCSQQRPTWMRHKKNRELRDRIAKASATSVELTELLGHGGGGGAFSVHDEEELWVERSSINSLRDVAQFHLNVTLDKGARDAFGGLDKAALLGRLDELLTYCAADVAVTHRVYQIVFPSFLEVCPHPVSFAALRHLSSVLLPVDRSWDAYVANAEATYHRLSDAVRDRLVALAEKALESKDDPARWSADPWLQQLDWSGQEVKMVKGRRKGDPPRPAARQKKPGMPRWYRDLFPRNDAPIGLTVRSRIAPLLLRLSWDGHPLVWSDKYGWTFRVPLAEAARYAQRQMTRCDDWAGETVAALPEDRDHAYFKLPHKDGPAARCANPMAKAYLGYFEKGILSSEYPYAKEALEMNASCSYWISARHRIMSQLVVYQDDVAACRSPSPSTPSARGDAAAGAGADAGGGGGGGGGGGAAAAAAPAAATAAAPEPGRDVGFILPQIIPMGTITRRAVENTWLTASNAKRNRVGSELKAMVKAPPGYVFVGADVDSEELWIASVVGDSTFRLHGGTAIGFMTLEGTKAAGTDLHSRTAAILGITRNDAKVFNYGRIYGAGLRFAAQLLRQFNPGLSERQTLDIAARLYATTKGTKTSRRALHRRPFWRGGTESFVFNKLEEFTEQERPRTPVLGAGITEALMGRFVSKGAYLTSRINWAVQSSGVDYLHLLVVAMDYLTRRFAIAARLALTVHDEIRYLVRREDRYRAALALQVANLWTRAMFAQQVGIDDLPQSCAFFSAVDVDTVLRKEVDMDCVTPSHPHPIPPGESLDIAALLARGPEARLDPAVVPDPARRPPRPEAVEYRPRVPVMQQLRDAAAAADGGGGSADDGDAHEREMRFIRAQIARDEAELRDILKEARKPSSAAAAPITSALSSSSSSSSSTAAAAAAAAKNTSPDAKTSKKQPTTSAKRAERQRRTGPAAPMPYHNEPRLVPAEFEPMSVTEALGAGGRFRQGGGHRASGAAGKWNWEKYGAKGAGGGGSSRSTRTGTGTSSSRL